MKPIAVIQHVDVEGPGLLGRLCETRIIGPGEALPADLLDRAGGIVVLGGPMGVYEVAQHPRLAAEIALLRTAVAREVPVLGICLGSQLLAAALGARVAPGPQKEIGWFDVTVEASDPLFDGLPRVFPALHWHGDVFDVVPGMRPLARSALTACQAFAAGQAAWGLLFHLEAGAAETAAMARAFPDELVATGVDPQRLVADADRHAAEVTRIGTAVFERWLSRVG